MDFNARRSGRKCARLPVSRAPCDVIKRHSARPTLDAEKIEPDKTPEMGRRAETTDAYLEAGRVTSGETGRGSEHRGRRTNQILRHKSGRGAHFLAPGHLTRPGCFFSSGSGGGRGGRSIKRAQGEFWLVADGFTRSRERGRPVNGPSEFRPSCQDARAARSSPRSRHRSLSPLRKPACVEIH